MSSIKPVSPLVLAGKEYLLAFDGSRYILYRPLPADDFGVVSHERCSDFHQFLVGPEAEALLQHLGAAITARAALEAAVRRD